MALSGEMATLIEPGTEIPLSLRTGLPIKNSSGRIIGVVSAGFSMVKTDFVDNLKNVNGNEFTIFIGDKRANTTVIKDGERVIGTSLDPNIAKIVIDEQKVYSVELKF